VRNDRESAAVVGAMPACDALGVLEARAETLGKAAP
jgi:hypothetical protein|tara:strand:+ start:1755 stop:1862 length:108 start_codon:yes stop_codon:yes gene_type:complete